MWNYKSESQKVKRVLYDHLLKREGSPEFSYSSIGKKETELGTFEVQYIDTEVRNSKILLWC